MRQVAVGFALDSGLKDKVSPETRYWEKLRDHGKMGLEIFVQRLETNITLGRHPPAWEWRRRLYPFKSIRREIKRKTFHEAEAYLKDVDKRIHHILNETTTKCSFDLPSDAFERVKTAPPFPCWGMPPQCDVCFQSLYEYFESHLPMVL